jgi:hypothetical protein
VKRGVDHFEDAVWIPEHVIVPEAQDSETPSRQVRVTFKVESAVCVLATIGFDDQRLLDAGKVDDVRGNHVLPTELCRGHASIAEH